MIRKRSFRNAIYLLVIGVVIGLILASNLDFTTTQRSLPVRPATVILGSQQEAAPQHLELESTNDAFVAIAERVIPTVVTIESIRVIRSTDMQKYHDRDDLRDFFKFRIPRDFRQRGSGSGIIVSKDGYVLTNVHVVEDAEKLRVILSDNREYDADIVGLDPLTEVAVIKIAADDLPVAKLGNSDEMRVGQWVLAIGNPLELTSSVTAGIISAKERRIDIIRDTYSVENFIQTDAAINPGNSGGALVNLSGEVIGVNTAIATETGYSAGFGFAIPINLAQKIMTDLIRKGKVERGYLGIAMMTINELRARGLGLNKPKGVFVTQIIQGEAAAKAGLKAKDVILKIDDQAVSKSNQVQTIIAKKSPGDRIRLEIFRKGKSMELDVVLGYRETESVAFTKREEKDSYEHLGLTATDLTAEKAQALSYSGIKSVLITGVEAWSPAGRAGIRREDIVLEIGDKQITNKDDFYHTIAALEAGSVVIFTIGRGDDQFHFFLEVPK